ncbi:hypothetical protein [Methanococcus maripaludis]|uniref:Uncharacterized protein n=2 Tax=Methanococcus maripaludis TaxID=39152 RepID=A0A7J9PFQ2_METMI|nr:hypothetical protein [Methanococcus maripaludis]MBA2861614.1 hypothetical protein [Methanococcus maripaludis]
MIKRIEISFTPQTYLVVARGEREYLTVFMRDLEMNPMTSNIKSFRRYVLRKNGIDFIAHMNAEFNTMDEIELKKEFDGIYTRFVKKGNIQEQFKKVDVYG